MMKLITIIALLAICASAAPPLPAAPMNASLAAFSHPVVPRAKRRVELQAYGVAAGDGSKCNPGLICVKEKRRRPRASLEESILGINVYCAQFKNSTVIKQKTHLFGVVMGIRLDDSSVGKIEVYISNIHQPDGIVMYEAYCKTLLYQLVTGCSPVDPFKYGGYNCDQTTGKVELKILLADLRLPS